MGSQITHLITIEIPHFFRNELNKYKQKKRFNEWQKNGRPVPPPHIVKQNIIREYQKKYGCNILVETGTYKGDMIEAQKKMFKKIISIELGRDLYKKARKRFAKNSNVSLWHGDSGTVLSKVMNEIDETAIFWLDGHYSSGITAKGETECPVFNELQAIFDGKKLDHVLLIDDARKFTGEGDYPAIDEVTKFIHKRNEKYKVELKHDIIRYVV